uniref:Uncharacterized protein n=1 Tax=Tanacetum cinerariifolium TaxID=118510 RepID=A0A6L2P691_TANCI|nr:hypothetical protein [Tanacetum cinerariifolium]
MTPDQLKAQEEELVTYEAKRAKISDEYNHCINFRDDPLPITKFSYRVNNSTKEATMRITRNNQPLNLKIYDKENEFHLATTAQLIKIQNAIKVESVIASLRRIQVRDIIKKVKDYLKTYSSAGMDISWYVDGIR